MSRPTGFFDCIGRLLAGSDLPRRTAMGAGLVLLLSVAALVSSAAITEIRVNPASRLATVESLVDYGEWRIDRTIYRNATPDKVHIDGEFYSSKPPVYAAIGSVVYAAIQWITGWQFAGSEYWVVFFLRVVLHIIPFFVGVILAGRFLRRRVVNDDVWFWGFVAFAAGTFIFGYSATINNHALAALLVLAGLAAATELTDDRRSPWLWFGAGFAAALAVSLDFGAGIFALGLATLLTVKAQGKGLVWFVAGALGPVLVHLHLTMRLSRSFLPFYGQSELYHYPGSYWLNTWSFDALNEPTWLYSFHALLGHHGLFSMTPLFLLAIPGLVLLCRRREERPIGVLAVAVIVLTLVAYIGFGPRNYGGAAMGMRWFIILTPLLWYAAVRYADTRWDSRTIRVLLPIVVMLGVFHAGAALHGPWYASPWNWFIRYLGMGSVPAVEWWP